MSNDHSPLKLKLAKTLSPTYDRVRPLLTTVLSSDRLAVHRPELQQAATKYVRYGTPCSYEPTPLTGPPPTPPTLNRFHRTLEVAGSFVCELPNVALVGPDLLAITPQHRYILEETNAKPGMLTDIVFRTLYHGMLPIRQEGAVQRFRRPVASLAGVQSRDYFHWFADYLPRVRGVEQYAEVTGEYPDVLVPANPPTWIERSIECIGIPDERLIEWGGGRAIAERLVIPAVPRDAADLSHVNYSPRELRWVGDRIRAYVDPDRGERYRVLITRRGATTRRFVNEEELIQTLAPLGFEPVDLTKLSFEDQVRLFANAEAVVAPHGAGLINTIYATDVKILEVFGEFVSPLYYCIAGGLGFPYRYERATETRPVVDSPGISGPGDDLVVNANRIKTSVQEWLAGERNES